MAKGLVGFYLLVKYEQGVSTLSHFGGCYVVPFCTDRNYGPQGLNTHPALAIMALVNLPIYNLVCSCG